MATKDFSNKQEHMIANYLGWDVVSGSGARDFNPGDVRSADWLGECKTHTKISDKLTIYDTHWTKIQKEARSVFKYPVLFVDNGSQDIDKTWAICDLTVASAATFKIIPCFTLLQKGTVNASFDHIAAKKLYHEYSAIYSDSAIAGVVFQCELKSGDVGLMPFRNFCDKFGNRR